MTFLKYEGRRVLRNLYANPQGTPRRIQSGWETRIYLPLEHKQRRSLRKFFVGELREMRVEIRRFGFHNRGIKVLTDEMPPEAVVEMVEQFFTKDTVAKAAADTTVSEIEDFLKKVASRGY